MHAPQVEKLRRAAAVGGASEKELAAKDTEIASLKTKVSRLEGELRAAQAAPAGAGVGGGGERGAAAQVQFSS
jgi:predicted  nucleic acid-binding Zn-ribbon protein